MFAAMRTCAFFAILTQRPNRLDWDSIIINLSFNDGMTDSVIPKPPFWGKFLKFFKKVGFSRKLNNKLLLYNIRLLYLPV